MDIVNSARLLLEGHMAVDKHGKRFLVAVAKATYDFPAEDGAAPVLSEKQQPVFTSDIFEGEAGLSTPYFEADTAYYKSRCDVVVKASACAPQGQAVERLDVAFKVGDCERWAHVVGDRVWRPGVLGLAPTRPEPFLRMPVTYSRAFGGTRFDGGSYRVYGPNPIGRGYASAAGDNALAGEPVPNIEVPGAPLDRARDDYAALSFGPIGRSWPARIGYAGTYDQHWQDEIFPLLPPDFDERFFQCAPPEQQIEHPRGGEPVRFYHLHPLRPQIAFALPRLWLPMVVLDRERQVHKLQPLADTLSFDVDAGQFSVVWRARHPLRRGIEEIDTLAAGSLCKRWWKSRVLGTDDCGCGGFETDDEDLAPVTEALED